MIDPVVLDLSIVLILTKGIMARWGVLRGHSHILLNVVLLIIVIHLAFMITGIIITGTELTGYLTIII
ncbi:MAG TPA: hypothetical protein DHU75_01385 [Rikenellaceae bacterium]|nr:hypothetical protein [Rikenellaceae bacterium]